MRMRLGHRSVRKLLKPLQHAIAADSCCKRSCDLGGCAVFKQFSTGPIVSALDLHRFTTMALSNFKSLRASNTSATPTAVLLPCTHFTAGACRPVLVQMSLLSLVAPGEDMGQSWCRCARVSLGRCGAGNGGAVPKLPVSPGRTCARLTLRRSASGPAQRGPVLAQMCTPVTGSLNGVHM